MRHWRSAIGGLAALALVPVFSAPHQAAADLYTTEGVHHVNGREWRTVCEPYSATERCRTEIKATTISYENGRFIPRTDWAFNNLTYKASPRSLWRSNPLGGNGVVGGKVSWTGSDGRAWRTECDTAVTGGGGCRSYIRASVIETYTTASGATAYRWVTKEIFNNMVRFGTPPPTGVAAITDPNLRQCVSEAAGKAGGLANIEMLICDSKGITTLKGLPNMPRLAYLSVVGNRVQSLQDLPALPRLEVLDARSNRLSGAINLATLPTALRDLDLSDNSLTSVTGARAGLRLLALSGNQLTNVSGLRNATNLVQLDLDKNRLTDVSPLSGLRTLVVLDLSDNQLARVSSLSGLTNLGQLWLAGNAITDLQTLQPLVNNGCSIDIWPGS